MSGVRERYEPHGRILLTQKPGHIDLVPSRYYYENMHFNNSHLSRIIIK